MTVPVNLASRIAGALVPLLLVPALLVAPPCRAEPPATSEQPFEADPLSKGPTGGPRVPPPGGFIALDEIAATDWAQRIDQTWGSSPLTIPQMLGVFDTFWNTIDQRFACFQGLDVDWTALRTKYRAEVQAGVRRGRFAAIMNHLALAMRESHTMVFDQSVNATAVRPGVPLFVVGGWGDNRHFRAGLTPLADSSLLVYKAAPVHPLGLGTGDIVLGYGGVPWKRLYRELLDAQLPLTGWWWGSSSSSWTHSMLMCAGLNWHLFDTIDVLKYATGDTVHLSVAPLSTPATAPLDCTEQLPIPGVPMPDYLGSGDPVSWGIVSGTQIGYVYVRAWTGSAGTQLYTAVHTLLTQHQTTGLIFDFRTNYGGNMGLAYPALELLFGEEVSTIGFVDRCSPTDHLGLCPSPNGPPSAYVIHGQAPANYDRPIAVLVGPGALSSGDQVAHLFSFHPRARFFGKSTATAFNGPASIGLGIGGWISRFAVADAYRVNAPDDYLTHDEFHVDEPVWLEPDDVVRGIDTVAEAAIRWINNRAPVCQAAYATLSGSGPPGRELEPVAIEGVSDPDGDRVTIAATAIAQDEPVNGNGDGDACPDATILDGVARVRWERAGTGDGRVYLVSFTASDGRGGESQGTVQLCVPHDRGKDRGGCVDGGERYDAMAACAATTTPRSAAAPHGLRGLPGAAGAVALEYSLPRDGWVDLGLYDVAGRRVLTLLREHQGAGAHRFEWSGDGPRPGVYFALLRLDQGTIARTAVVVR
jgi:peptidase S41-like protein